MKNILVLTDFSHPAYAALFYITGLYRNQVVDFHIIHSYTVGDGEEKAWLGLSQAAHRIRLDRKNPKHTFTTRAIEGDLTRVVLDEVKKASPDIIVMGNKGEGQRNTIFLGSNVIAILNVVTSCPVLTVPEVATDDKPQEIAFASAFSRDYKPESMRPLLEIATMCSAAIRIVHINEEEGLDQRQMEHLNSLMHFMGNTAHTLHWIPDFRTKAGALNAFITELGIGMLAMVHQKHGFLDTLLGEQIIQKIHFMISVPMLVLPEGKAG